MHTLPGELIHLPKHRVGHGVVHARAGNQGKNGHDQIGNCRIFAHPGHGFGINRGEQRGPEVAHDVAAAQFSGDTVDKPGQPAADGAQNSAGAVDVEQNGKADAAQGREQTLHADGVRNGDLRHRHSPQKA